jgi:hypothetical protein
MILRELGGVAVLGLLLAGCGGGDGGGSSNKAPVANAGAAQNVAVGGIVTLDGSASSDADGDTLTYAWSLTELPTGSAATLSSLTAQRPTFTPDVAGTYVARLVVNDGTVSSTPATVTITAAVVDVTAPTTTVAPSVSGTISTGTTLSVTIDEAGTGYYLVLPEGAAAPTVEALMSTGTSFAMSANVAAAEPISGLSTNSPYTIYFVAKDAANNAQPAVQIVAVMTTCTDAGGTVLTYQFGTDSPPATIGGFTMQPFDAAAQGAVANYTSVTTIPGSPIPGDLTLSVAASKRTVPGGGWATWSHGYTGVVYMTDGPTNTLTLPAGARAFYLYAEPNNGPFDMTLTTDSGATCGPISVVGVSGATGFGFSSTDATAISSITVTAPAGASGFAVGEFAISP